MELKYENRKIEKNGYLIISLEFTKFLKQFCGDSTRISIYSKKNGRVECVFNPNISDDPLFESDFLNLIKPSIFSNDLNGFTLYSKKIYINYDSKYTNYFNISIDCEVSLNESKIISEQFEKYVYLNDAPFYKFLNCYKLNFWTIFIIPLILYASVAYIVTRFIPNLDSFFWAFSAPYSIFYIMLEITISRIFKNSRTLWKERLEDTKYLNKKMLFHSSILWFIGIIFTVLVGLLTNWLSDLIKLKI